MPIYEYKCSSCQEQMEVMQKISDPALSVCPECGGALSKLISSSSFILKGGGWYADGYSSANKDEMGEAPAKPNKTEKADKPAKSETKAATSVAK
jgi:putative FmdB family regulatory protein